MTAKRGASEQPKGGKTKRPHDGRRQASLLLLAVWRRSKEWGPPIRKLLWRGFALLASFVLFLTVMVAVAGWYTSRSEFCNSCHIMELYCVSWQESSHANVPASSANLHHGSGRRCERRFWAWSNSPSTSLRAKGHDRPPKYRTPVASDPAATKPGCCQERSSSTVFRSTTSHT